jgi:hypothetical protein
MASYDFGHHLMAMNKFDHHWMTSYDFGRHMMTMNKFCRHWMTSYDFAHHLMAINIIPFVKIKLMDIYDLIYGCSNHISPIIY